MNLSTALQTVALLLAAVVVGLLIGHTAGCQPLQQLDETIWGAHDQTPGDPENPGLVGTPIGVTVTEAIAALLATAGFGGMAGWIRRIKRAANNNNAEIKKDVAGLADRLAVLEGKKK